MNNNQTRQIKESLALAGVGLTVAFFSIPFASLILLSTLGAWRLQQRRKRQIIQIKVPKLNIKQISDAMPTVRSETLFGKPMEVINMMLVGSPHDLETAMERADWYRSDHITVRSLLHALRAMLKNRPYPVGPVTPCFVNGQMQTYSFQRPTERNTFRNRHHLRVWETDLLSSDNRQIWLASAVQDEGMRLTARPWVVTHRIASDVDTERDYVVRELERVGGKLHDRAQYSAPLKGKNAYGDNLTTDGEAVVMELTHAA
jgi:hypothetical protein